LKTAAPIYANAFLFFNFMTQGLTPDTGAVGNLAASVMHLHDAANASANGPWLLGSRFLAWISTPRTSCSPQRTSMVRELTTHAQQ
jgi:hypothetical protein